MNLVSLKCPNCGGSLILEDKQNDIFDKSLFCQYCGRSIVLKEVNDSIIRAKVTIEEFEHNERIQRNEYQHEERMKDKQYKHEEVMQDKTYKFKSKNEKKKFINIIIGFLVFISPFFLLLFIIIFLYKVGPIREEIKTKHLEDNAIQIETLIKEGNYEEALIKANSLYYDGDDSKKKIQWDKKRENYIERIISKIEEIEDTNNPRIEAPISSNDISKYKYKDIYSIFNLAGFTNIFSVSLSTKKDPHKGIDDVEYITINGQESFSSNELFPIDSNVYIYYYTEKSKDENAYVPVSSINFEGDNYKNVYNILDSAGFSKIETVVLNQKNNPGIGINEVEYVTINGVKDFTIEDYYPLNSDIFIYYYSEESVIPTVSVPSSAELYRGQNYYDVRSSLILAGFTKIKVFPSEKAGLFKKANTVKDIIIDGNFNFEEKEEFNREVPIYIYYYSE